MTRKYISDREKNCGTKVYKNSMCNTSSTRSTIAERINQLTKYGYFLKETKDVGIVIKHHEPATKCSEELFEYEQVTMYFIGHPDYKCNLNYTERVAISQEQFDTINNQQQKAA
jgi:hypothetical protein